MVTAAHRAKRFHPFWNREYRDLTAKIGKQKAVVAIAGCCWYPSGTS